MRPLKTILVGVDFTPCSLAALREATRLAAQSRARVHVAHIIDTQIALQMEAALAQLQGGIRDGLISDARRSWKEFVSRVPEASSLEIEISVEHRVLGLLRKAQENAADLLVLGAFGSQHPDVGAGTVATACVRNASVDVLLVRDTHQGPFSTVVVGVDFSETSRRALERAAQIAERDRGALDVVHVFTSPWDISHYPSFLPPGDPKFLQRFESLLKQRLVDFVRPITEANPSLSVTCDLFDAGPHRSGIVEYAERKEANLVCLGTRGQSNLRDFFLGSTAEKVLLHSKCSVLAVKPDASPSR